MNTPISFSLHLSTVVALVAAVSVSHAEEITLEDFGDLPKADVYVLGEIHDNPEHHVAQAEAILAIEAGAVVFEMLSDAQALRIRPDLLKDSGELAKVLEWDGSGWPDFEIYYPIFEASHGAVFFGGQAPIDDVRQAITDGASDVMGASANLFGLTDALDDAEQTDREAGQMAAHCDAMPINMLPGMVEAQRLRDAYMARAVLAALAESDGPVAVITGNGHARLDWGVPALLETAAPDVNVFALGQFEAAPTGKVPFDQWLVTEPIERDDPCAAFSKD